MDAPSDKSVDDRMLSDERANLTGTPSATHVDASAPASVKSAEAVAKLSKNARKRLAKREAFRQRKKAKKLAKRLAQQCKEKTSDSTNAGESGGKTRSYDPEAARRREKLKAEKIKTFLSACDKSREE